MGLEAIRSALERTQKLREISLLNSAHESFAATTSPHVVAAQQA